MRHEERKRIARKYVDLFFLEDFTAPKSSTCAKAVLSV